MELYAVQYGENFKYANYKTIYKNDNRTELVRGFVFLYYIAKIEGKVILFDTGFRKRETAEWYEVTLFDIEDEIFALIGGKVDTIFITHAHFDHVDNLDLFPSAELIVSCGTWKEMQQNSPELIKNWIHNEKLHIVEKELVYQDSFRFTVIDGHMKGSSVIYIDERNKKYVIAGDEAYFCDNFERNIPNGNTFDSKKNAEFIENIHHERIVTLPYHDGKIIASYPKISKHIVRII